MTADWRTVAYRPQTSLGEKWVHTSFGGQVQPNTFGSCQWLCSYDMWNNTREGGLPNELTSLSEKLKWVSVQAVRRYLRDKLAVHFSTPTDRNRLLDTSTERPQSFELHNCLYIWWLFNSHTLTNWCLSHKCRWKIGKLVRGLQKILTS